jgi:hypothetical protein
MMLPHESNTSLVREEEDEIVRDPEAIIYFGYCREVLE